MKLNRTLALSLFVSLLFFGSATPAHAQSWWDTFLNVTGFNKNISKTLEAVKVSEEEGTPSHESFVDNNLLNVQSSLFVYVAGPPDSALQRMSEEEKRVVYERYGHGAIGAVGTGITALYTPPAS